MHVLISHNDEKYQPLADITWDQNKVLYAEKHGYSYYNRTEGFATANEKSALTGFEKLYIAKDVFEHYPDCEWLWWTGTDTLITNFETKIEDKIDNNYHIIMSVDINGINDDSMLIRNSPEGLAFLNHIQELEEEFMQYWDVEQGAMCHAMGFPRTGDPSWPKGADIIVNEKYRSIVKLMPQRYMNSFNYEIYGNFYSQHNDRMGFDGNWQPGDWLIHWPATSVEQRIQLANAYKEHIIK